MSTVLEHPKAAAPSREAPNNIEAEQALLGAILANNEALNHVGGILAPDDFYAGIHQRIFAAILQFNDKGQIANPITLKRHFAGTDGVEDNYLAKLVATSTSIVNIHDYARTIRNDSLRRRLIDVCEQTANSAYIATDITGLAQIEQTEQKLFNLAATGHQEGGFISVGQSLDSVLFRAEAAYKRSGEVIGLSTGFSDLNRVLGGLHPSDLLILAGRPSMGKTALATNIAINAAEKIAVEDENAERKRTVGIFSLEMSSDQLSMRLLSGETGIPSHAIQNGSMNQEQFARLIEAKRRMQGLPLHIDDTAALTIGAIRSRARRLKRTKNLSLLVVDYLQLLRANSSSNNSNRVQEISEISQGLKAIAKELNIPVIALSQLSRAVEQRDDKRPLLSDLRESGSIEQDADIVMFVYRDEYYLQRSEPKRESTQYDAWSAKMEAAKGLAEVIIAKHRNGPTANIEMRFEGHSTKFSDYLPGSFL